MFNAPSRLVSGSVPAVTLTLALGLALTGCGSDGSSSDEGSAVNPAASAVLPKALQEQQKACNDKGRVFRFETTTSGVCSGVPLASHECSRDGLWGALSPYRDFKTIMTRVDEALAEGYVMHQCGRGPTRGDDAIDGREFADAIYVVFVRPGATADGFTALFYAVGLRK